MVQRFRLFRPKRKYFAQTLIFAVLSTFGCTAESLQLEAQLGRPIIMATGDASTLPRLAFWDRDCNGTSGGCEGEACKLMLIDTLAPLTLLPEQGTTSSTLPRLTKECLELRSAYGMAEVPPAAQALQQAITRARLRDVHAVRVPPSEQSNLWFAGDDAHFAEVGGVLGGNVLRELAVAFRQEPERPPTVAFFRQFPGTSQELADGGYTFLPVQFPGRLLGMNLYDRCQIGESSCQLTHWTLGLQEPQLAVVNTIMVMDACMSAPPCALTYTPADDPQSPGQCHLQRGFSDTETCTHAASDTGGGKDATLIVATGIPGLVLFADSAVRMFGELDALPPCSQVSADTLACFAGQTSTLYAPGWPPLASAGQPARQIKIRNFALVPGATRVTSQGACARADNRQKALRDQCAQTLQTWEQTGQLAADANTPRAPSSSLRTAGSSSLFTAGQWAWPEGITQADSAGWVDVWIIPETHSLPMSLRRSVEPFGNEPDGLLGSAIFQGTEVVLDAKGASPSLRARCVDPQDPACLSLPSCSVSGSPSCCFGLPESLLIPLIEQGGAEVCCNALSPITRMALQANDLCL